MKKIICGIVLSLGLVGTNASAFEIQSNDAVMKQVLIQSVLQQLLGGNTNINNQVKFTIGTGNINNGMGIQQCWSKFVYHSDGSKTPKIVCY